MYEHVESSEPDPEAVGGNVNGFEQRGSNSAAASSTPVVRDVQNDVQKEATGNRGSKASANSMVELGTIGEERDADSKIDDEGDTFDEGEEGEALELITEGEEKEKEESDEADEAARRWILSQPIVWKFCAYGFLKNLQLFEAYLVIVLLSAGHNLSAIGILQGIQAFATVACEYPSGMIADKLGKKTSLQLCFIIYAASFAIYGFATKDFRLLTVASALYGIGEAFRSGCHKAMIIAWLERHGRLRHKTFLYSRTRSFSNLGSALNAALAITLVTFLPNSTWIFKASALPMLLDFAMVSTYPSYMNDTAGPSHDTIFGMIRAECSALATLMRARTSRKRLLSASMFQSLHKGLKDYIQPVMLALGGEMLTKWGLVRHGNEGDKAKGVKILVGILYALFYLISCLGTRNAYRIAALFPSEKKAMDRMFDCFCVLSICIGLSVALRQAWPVMPMYLLLYFLTNTRRPVSVSQVSELMGRERRATVMSVESLIVSILVFMFAPVLGSVANFVGLDIMFFGTGLAALAFNNIFLAGE